MVPQVKRSDIGYRFSIVVYKVATFILAVSLPVLVSSCGGLMEVDPLVEAKKAIEDSDPFMGDWQGGWALDDGFDSGPLIAQVTALGKGKYRANFNAEFEYGWPPLFVLEGGLKDSAAQFDGRAEFEGNVLYVQSGIKEGKFSGKFKGSAADGQAISGSIVMEKTIRLSPTLGAKPPAGAIVLFNGKNFKQWRHTKKKSGSVKWARVKGRAMEVRKGAGSIVTKKKFTDFKLHLEFRTPFMPEKSGQGRGNSGVYLQERYEVQVLDSYGLEGKDNECGGIYKIGPPLVNMCAPPMQWQTYDITFYAPKPGGTGATVTVVHNGETIHDNLALPKPTGGALDNNVAEPGGIYLQDHGNPVQFRNIWLVEL